MCGRYAITSAPERIRRLLDYLDQPNYPARYNIAPTQPIPIVRLMEGRRQFALARWGFVPSWVKDPKTFSLVINARGETVNDKPAFRNAMKRRRCLIPADGFYEWKNEGAAKRPFYIRCKDGEPFAFAGLWETWTGPNGEEVDGAAIVTTSANRVLAPIHHRMPVILTPEMHEMWLDTARVDAATAAALIAPAQDELFEAREVSPLVNRVTNDGPELLAPYAAPPVEQPPVKAKGARAPKPKADDGQTSLF